MKKLDEAFEKITLYKYANALDLKYLLSTHNNKPVTLAFRSIHEYNDPFEGHFRVDCPEQSIESIKQITLNWKATLRQHFLATCFSTDNNNTLMWAHYANNHTGICLEFSIDHGFIKEDNCNIYLGEVEYSSKYPTYELTSDSSREYRDLMMLNSMIRKSRHWAYEKEYRLIINTQKPNSPGIKKIPFAVTALKSVAVGVRMPDTCAQKVKKYIDKHNEHNNTDVQFHEPGISYNSYKITNKNPPTTSDPELDIVFINESLCSNKKNARRRMQEEKITDKL